MFLYAGGDSFTYGVELFEDPVTQLCNDNEARLRCAWPGNLANRLGFDGHKNDGMGGSSNDRIFRRCVAFVTKWLAEGKSPDDLFVVIGWSSPERTEFRFSGEDGTYEDTHFEYIQFYRNVENSIRFPGYSDGVKDYLRLYNKCFNGEVEARTRFANQVISLQSILKVNKIRYMFFNAAWIVKPETGDEKALFKMIDPVNFYKFRGYDYNETMFGWIRHVEKLPLGPRLHPDAEGHDRWAERIAAYIKLNCIFG